MPLKVACTCQQSDWLSTHDGLNTRVARSPESTVLPCQHNFSVRVPERGSLAKHTARLAREIEVIMRVRVRVSSSVLGCYRILLGCW